MRPAWSSLKYEIAFNVFFILIIVLSLRVAAAMTEKYEGSPVPFPTLPDVASLFDY